ncbi:MAG: HlyD family efflux transporter periplasmic adaptor subunit [Pirellulaceae bacterium]
MAKDSHSRQRFETEFIDRLVELTAADSAAIWSPSETLGAATHWRLRAERTGSGDDRDALWLDPANRTLRARLVELASNCEDKRTFAAEQRIPEFGNAVIPCDLTFAIVQIDDEPIALIELTFPPNRCLAVRDGTNQLLDVATEIALDYYRSWNLRQLKDRTQARGKLDRFVLRAHQDFDLARVCQSIANDGRELLQCDRLSVLLRKGKQMKLESVSGVDLLDRRSQTLFAIERLARDTALDDRSCWFRESEVSADAFPAVKQYFADTEAERVGLVAIHSTGHETGEKEPLALFVVEYFDSNDRFEEDVLQGRAEWMALHASSAIGNASRVSRLPFSRFSRWLDANVLHGRRVSFTLILALAIIGGVIGLCVVPAQFVIEARGELQPVHQELIFAPREGIVTSLPAIEQANMKGDTTTGTRVQPEDIVVQLQNSELEYQLTTLLGEQATTDQQLDSTAVILEQIGRSSDPQQRTRFDELTAQSQELRVRKQALEKRIKLLRDELATLSVRAGMAGEILTWKVVDELMLKPVQQGERLMRIIDPDGPWRLELYVPDRHIGYVQAGRQSRTEPQMLTFIHKSDPQREYHGVVSEIAMSTEWYPQYGAAVRVVGEIRQDEQMTSLRPGTTVIAKIDCGRKPMGYVWLYDLIDTVRMKLLF